VRIDGKTYEVEVTSVHGDRKLGDEYKTLVAPNLDPVDKWVERGRQIPDALEAAIKAKVAKHYAARPWLVIYLNINEYGLLRSVTERAIEKIKQRYGASFEAIFVLWKEKVL
jgi:phosphatidylserine decarboxylase